MAAIRITPDNYLISNGMKLCRVEGDELVFFDRRTDRRKRRESQIGEGDVRVNVLDLVRAIAGREQL